MNKERQDFRNIKKSTIRRWWTESFSFLTGIQTVIKLTFGELRSATSTFETVLKISMCRFSLIFQGFSGFWITVAPFINTENEGIIRPFSVIECCIYHTRKLFRLIILYFRINVHRRFAVLMSSQILNCFRINPCIKKIAYVCMSQLMGRHFKI